MAPEVIDAHLRTRFSQLKHCTAMKHWNEAFHTVEDIHGLLEHTMHTPKVHMMASYYQDFADVLWATHDNYLTHAHAYFSYYTLAANRNTALTGEQRILHQFGVDERCDPPAPGIA